MLAAPMRVAVATAVLAAVVAVLAATAPAASRMQLSCAVGGKTVVTGITVKKAHFGFRWWYADGSSQKSAAFVWYAASLSHGTAWIPTHGNAVRAEATMHRAGVPLVHVRTSCS
jgi:hypothetical protein